MFAIKVNEKTTIELDDVLELHDDLREDDQWKDNQYEMQQKIESSYFSEEVERKSSIPRGMTYLAHQGEVMKEKKTMEENNVGAENTIEMSLRLLGGIEKGELMDTLESEEREKKRKLEECVKENWRDQVKTRCS